MCIRLGTIPRDGRTDRQTDRRSELVKQYCAMYDMRAEAR